MHQHILLTINPAFTHTHTQKLGSTWPRKMGPAITNKSSFPGKKSKPFVPGAINLLLVVREKKSSKTTTNARVKKSRCEEIDSHFLRKYAPNNKENIAEINWKHSTAFSSSFPCWKVTKKNRVGSDSPSSVGFAISKSSFTKIRFVDFIFTVSNYLSSQYMNAKLVLIGFLEKNINF